MHILFTIHNDYCQHMAVALVSLIRNSPGADITFHVIGLEVTNQNKRRLQKVVGKYSAAIQWYSPPDLTRLDLKIDGHASEVNYYRLFISEILPPSVQKVLYLDADLVVLADIRPLWEIDLSGYPIGAVNHENIERSTSLGIPANQYFNSGVMLINLELWRELEVADRFREFISSKSHLIRYWDQDVLNFVFYKQARLIERRFNQPKNEEVTDNTIVLHYTGKLKPWNFHYPHSNRRKYFQYLRLTPWWFFGVKYFLWEEKNVPLMLQYVCFAL